MKDKSKLITIVLGILLVLSLAGNIYLANNKDTDPKININKTYGGGGIDGKDVVDLTSEEYITIMDNTKIYLYRQNEPMKLGTIKLLAEPNLYIADIDGMELYIFFVSKIHYILTINTATTICLIDINFWISIFIITKIDITS